MPNAINCPQYDSPLFHPYEIIGVPDGYIWNLGEDYEVELIATGGHSAGHAAYLDKKARILFSGDNICSDTCSCENVGFPRDRGPYGDHTCLPYYRENVKRMVERIDEYDYIFPQHFMVNLESPLMIDVLEALDSILEDPVGNADYKTETWGKDRGGPMIHYYKHIHGFSVIKYQVRLENK